MINEKFMESIKERCIIIAEAGVNHNGDVNLAKRLCLAAKEAGADVVKFQTWITEKIITKNVQQAEYQKENTGSNQSQYEMLKALELSFDQFREIKAYCDEIGILFASTADENDSLEFLLELGIPFIKIGSGDIGNIPFLRYVGSKQIPVILSTGMSSLEDIDISLEALKQGGAKEIVILHCTTSYPCAFESVNLNAMNTLEDIYGYKVGYSDHTVGIEVPIAAVAKGARVIEKHFTLDKNMPGPDHIASTEPTEFKAMVQGIRLIEKALGSGKKMPTKEEMAISDVVLKRIVANEVIKKGAVITEKDICVKRSDCGVSVKKWDQIVGSIALKDYELDEGIVLE